MLTSAARETLADRADGHRRRGARGRGHQTRRASGAVAGAPRPAAGRPPRSASGCRRRCARPRRWRGSCPAASRGRTTIVAPPAAKTFDLSVQVPVPDMANLENNSIWPDVEERIVDLIETHRSSIVFANSRRLAERLTSRLNEIHAERTGIELAADATRRWAAARPRTSWPAARPTGAEPLLARAHHGSVSKETARRRSKTTSRADGCGRSSPPPAWNWASTWARSTW